MYSKSCKDLHKSWHLLLIFHVASQQNLFFHKDAIALQSHTFQVQKDSYTFPFQCISPKTNQTSSTYLIKYLRFLQGIIKFRMGVRRRSHPKYQIIEIYDSVQDALMPEEVRNLSNSYASKTTSGNYSAGEDFDFILREKNRQLKAWNPKGMPTDEIW